MLTDLAKNALLFFIQDHERPQSGYFLFAKIFKILNTQKT